MSNTSKTPVSGRKETSYSMTTKMSDERYRNQVYKLADEASLSLQNNGDFKMFPSPHLGEDFNWMVIRENPNRYFLYQEVFRARPEVTSK